MGLLGKWEAAVSKAPTRRPWPPEEEERGGLATTTTWSNKPGCSSRGPACQTLSWG